MNCLVSTYNDSPHVQRMLLSDTPAVDFVAAVHRQSWDWFLDFPYRLNIAAEILDDKGVPVLPALEGQVAATLRRLLTTPGNASLRTALAAAMQSRTCQVVSVEGLEVAYCPLTLGGSAGGTLVLARQEPAGRPSVELQTLGSWISSVIEAHLVKVGGDEKEAFDRVASLHRLLNQTVPAGSAPHVVGAFAEALAVWDDIETRGYVKDVRGEFVLNVTLAGSDRTAAPATLDDEFVGGENGVVRLSNSDAERLGFRPDTDVLMVGFGNENGKSWLIVFCGRIAARDEARLTLYVNLLREAVRHAERVAAARFDWSLLEHLLVATDDIELAARAALRELTAAVKGDRAALMVTTANGMHVLSIGDAAAFSDQAAAGQVNQIASTTPLLDRYTLLIAVRRSRGEAFLRREQQLVESAAALFGSWLSGVLRRPAFTKDRRVTRHRFEDVIQRMAEQTVRQGASVSVVVMAASEAAFQPGLLREWIADIRGQLRATDLVGPLTDSEIAVLLAEATAADAASVVERLRSHLGSTRGARPSAIGVATRSAGWSADDSVVNAAREDARQHSCA